MTDLSGPPPAHRLPGVATALGVAIVSTAIAVSAIFARADGDLDTSIFVMGLLATSGLLGVAICAQVLLPDAERRATLVSWPGAAGIVGAAIMLAVAIDDDPVAAYAAASTVVVLSLLSYAATTATPFVLTAIAGLALLYGQAFSDVIDTDGDGANTFMIQGAAVLVFVGAVTAVGWLLPKTRVLSAVVVGVGGILVLAVLFEALVVFGQFQAYADHSSSEGAMYSGSYEQLQGQHMDETYISEDSGDDYGYPDEPSFAPERDNSYTNDIWVMLSYGVALALFWAICALATGHVAFRIMSVAILVLAVPASTFALAVHHPTWWLVALTGLGGLVLVGVGYRTMKAAPVSAEPSAT